MNTKSLLLVTAALSLTMTEAFAGGLLDRQRSTRAQGLSFAGVTAGSGGLQSMGFNPAALGTIAVGSYDTAIAGGLTYSQTAFEGQPTIGGAPVGVPVDAGVSGFSGYSYFGYRLSDQVIAGLAITMPFSSSVEYDIGWLGQFDAVSSDIGSIQISPTIAYQPTDDLTLAFAANILLTDYETVTAAFGTDLDSVEFGFSMGALWNATPTTTIGLAYTHGFNVNADGTINVFGVGTTPGTVSFDLPSVVSFGIVQGVNDNLRLMGEVQWENWSVLDQIDVAGPGFGLTSTDVRAYEDSFFIALGGEYDMPGSNWTLRGGLAYDQTPTNTDLVVGVFPPAVNPLATNRTAFDPQADRILASIGGAALINGMMQVDLAYTYVHATEDAFVGLRNAPAGAQVLYDGSAHILSVGFSSEF